MGWKSPNKDNLLRWSYYYKVSSCDASVSMKGNRIGVMQVFRCQVNLGFIPVFLPWSYYGRMESYIILQLSYFSNHLHRCHYKCIFCSFGVIKENWVNDTPFYIKCMFGVSIYVEGHLNASTRESVLSGSSHGGGGSGGEEYCWHC